MNFIKLYFCIVLSGLSLMIIYKLLFIDIKVSTYSISDNKINKVPSLKLLSKQIEIVNEKRKNTELCDFWTKEFFKNQIRLTKESMDKYCIKP